MPRKKSEPAILHALGTPVDVPPPEREQLLRLGLLHEESSSQVMLPGPLPATASKRSNSSGASKPRGKKSQ